MNAIYFKIVNDIFKMPPKTNNIAKKIIKEIKRLTCYLLLHEMSLYHNTHLQGKKIHLFKFFSSKVMIRS